MQGTIGHNSLIKVMAVKLITQVKVGNQTCELRFQSSLATTHYIWLTIMVTSD